MVSTSLKMLHSQPILDLNPVWEEFSLYILLELTNYVSLLFKMLSIILYIGDVIEIGLQFSNLRYVSVDLGKYT